MPSEGWPTPGAPADAPAARAYRDGHVVAEAFALDDVPALLADGALVWADATGRPDAVRRLGRELGLSEHVLEDVVGRHERPRADHHDGYVFVNAYATRYAPGTGVEVREVSAVVMPRLLLTVGAASVDLPQVVSRWEEDGEMRRHGGAGLLHGLLDVLVDEHYATAQAIDEEVDAVEDLLFDDRSQREVQERTYLLRKALVQLRRAVLPMRDVAGSLLHRDSDLVDDRIRPHYLDLYDHTLRAGEWVDSLRDLVTTMFETTLSLADHRLNVVIKKLTGWAAIIAVPTLITGFFGQNVEFPGEGAWSGLALSVASIAATAGVLYALFRRNDWI
jgi:magnesium transporter